MKVHTLNKSINKAFLKVSPHEDEFNAFKRSITEFYNRFKESAHENESEEHQKNIVSGFLNDVLEGYSINTSGRIDLTISEEGVGKPNRVLFEFKRSNNQNEMINQSKVNCKSLQEILYYYLNEREQNIYINFLIITNGFEWYVFDSKEFENHFYSNKKLINDFREFKQKHLSDDKTDFFYKEIAYPIIERVKDELNCYYFTLTEYFVNEAGTIKLSEGEKLLKAQIVLFKFFSSTHLLKEAFINDSNTLDKGFYNELLHIMGLKEIKVNSKKIIGRFEKGERQTGSLLENAIEKIEDKDLYLKYPNKEQLGNNKEEILFSMGLGLVITWINRILFLKLLEGQLKSCRPDGSTFGFLSYKDIKSYDQLSDLFFAVLAKPLSERRDKYRPEYDKVPYLNSSLFERTEQENTLFDISSLGEDAPIKVLSNTVLKDEVGNKIVGKLDGVEYLLRFLDAYDFGSDGQAIIQKDRKTLINASVLGLVFEKINGYKDGSFFTPGFITMYLCNKTIRKRIVDRFSDEFNKQFKSIDDIYNQLDYDSESLLKANKVIDNIRICDPSVGSGHFLVSALNELILIKSELGILSDEKGKRLKGYHAEVVNDELIISDDDGDLITYKPHNIESARIQKLIFEEKRKIIENCLFGVDINPNSVKICRLRLWIELLKNAYYKDKELLELETLPNIDINIKQGNSVAYKYEFDESIDKPLKNNGWDINYYREMIHKYQNAQDKETKFETLQMINKLKDAVKVDMSQSNRLKRDFESFNGSLIKLTTQGELFEISNSEKKKNEIEEKRLRKRIKNLEVRIKEIEEGELFKDSFEWRFEFPEILDSKGNFIGFDVIIGNPPYIQIQSMNGQLEPLDHSYKTYEKTGDIYCLFYELGAKILRADGVLGYITSNKWMRAVYGKSLRNLFYNLYNLDVIIDLGNDVFEEATVDSNLLVLNKSKKYLAETIPAIDLSQSIWVKEKAINQKENCQIVFIEDEPWTMLSLIENNIKTKIENSGKPLTEWDVEINRGILTGYNEAFIISDAKRNDLVELDRKNSELIHPIYRGRDIRRYKPKFENLFLINPHNGIKDKGVSAIDINGYPTLKEHLKQYYKALEKRTDKGITPYNLRNCAYLDDFKKDKIIWGEICTHARFAYDEDNIYIDKTGWIMTGDNLKYLTVLLNSKLMYFSFKHFYSGYVFGANKEGGERISYSKTALNRLPIMVPDDETEARFIGLHDEMTNLKHNSENTDEIEKKIDSLVYELYDLTEEEIDYIESEKVVYV